MSKKIAVLIESDYFEKEIFSTSFASLKQVMSCIYLAVFGDKMPSPLLATSTRCRWNAVRVLKR